LHVLETLMPIFILVTLGAILKKINFLPEDFFKGINKITFYIGLPALLFHQIALAKVEIGDAGKILVSVSFGMTIAIPLGYFIAKLLDLPSRSIGTFIQACFRCNMAYVGLPVVLYAFSNNNDTQAGQLATLAMAPLIPYTNILSIFILAKSTEKKENISSLIWKSIKNPIVVSCIIALPISYFSLQLPRFFLRSCEALGRMALPLALLSIGSSLNFEKIKGNINASIIASIVNVFGLPLFGWIAAKFLNMNKFEIMIALILLACPAASSSYIMVQQLGGDESLAGSSIVISTILSIIPLSLIVAFFS